MSVLNYSDLFLPGYFQLLNFEKKGIHPFSITIKRKQVLSYRYDYMLTEKEEENYFYTKKILLTLLWLIGGDTILFRGDSYFIRTFIRKASKDEEIKTSFFEMEEIFNCKMTMKETNGIDSNYFPVSKVQGDFEGCRIGLDLGGSDRKVTALIDGNVVYSEETLWFPKNMPDWHYHYQGILDSLSKAKEKLPRVDSIGISTAGIIIEDRIVHPALFYSVPKEEKRTIVRDLIINLMKEHFPNIPYHVFNDGDVSAFGGAMEFEKNSILGIAMGTSLASGYCFDKNCLNGCINELGKIPIDYSANASMHYLMKIKGAGSEYLSQKGVIRLCRKGGLQFDGPLALQLVSIQKEAEKDNPIVIKAYEDMGYYLGSSLALYHKFIQFDSVLLLGRVMSKKGGDILLSKAREFLKDIGLNIEVFTSDENFRRLGQSYIAASM